jgi:hypothetical protein
MAEAAWPANVNRAKVHPKVSNHGMRGRAKILGQTDDNQVQANKTDPNHQASFEGLAWLDP